jgi:hypothetical protein
MSTVNAVPRKDSYVIEWAAVQITGAEAHSAIKRLFKNSPWVAQMVLEANDEVVFVFTNVHPTGMEQWTLRPGDWVVKSPHGKFWFMDNAEYESQFEEA